MATVYTCALTNSKGLDRIILFKGLEFDVVVTPSVLGEPVISAQPFYFLQDLDAVAKIRLETRADVELAESRGGVEGFIEYLLDNYLFAYSKRHPESKLTSKVYTGKFWRNDLSEAYWPHDNMNTACLEVDMLNDPAIIECKDSTTGDEYYEYCIAKEYTAPIFDEYLDKLKEVFSKEAYLKTENHSALGTGEYKLPVILNASRMFTYHEATSFEAVDVRDFDVNSSFYTVSRGLSGSGFQFPQEVVIATEHHDRELLAYYHSALRDHSPLTRFRNLYNVIEFFFEDAADIKSVQDRIERNMIKAVFQLVTKDDELLRAILQMGTEVASQLTTNQLTSSGVEISGMDLSSDGVVTRFAERTYEVRNACMHSKKTRRGIAQARFVPSSVEEEFLRIEGKVLQWIAVKVIEWDTATHQKELRT